MLTISIDRLGNLLDLASAVGATELVLTENEDVEAADGEAIGNLDEALGEDPAYQELLGTLEALTPDEVYQLLALALLTRHGSAPEEWQAMVTLARTTPAEKTLDELARTLLLTDEIELALEALGYVFDDEEDDAEDEAAEENKNDGEAAA